MRVSAPHACLCPCVGRLCGVGSGQGRPARRHSPRGHLGVQSLQLRISYVARGRPWGLGDPGKLADVRAACVRWPVTVSIWGAALSLRPPRGPAAGTADVQREISVAVACARGAQVVMWGVDGGLRDCGSTCQADVCSPTPAPPFPTSTSLPPRQRSAPPPRWTCALRTSTMRRAGGCACEPPPPSLLVPMGRHTGTVLLHTRTATQLPLLSGASPVPITCERLA